MQTGAEQHQELYCEEEYMHILCVYIVYTEEYVYIMLGVIYGGAEVFCA